MSIRTKVDNLNSKKNFKSIFFQSNRNHYSQHQQSVEAARRSAAARLENFDGNTQQAIPSDDICGLCERY